MSFTFAQISDLHMGPVPFFGPRHWNLKRALGFANWHRGRRQSHQMPVLAQIVADIRAQKPDHIAVTGDLVNIGLPFEHERALTWLQALGAPEQVSVIPGNHDIYTNMRGDIGALRWADYMKSDATGSRHDSSGEGSFIKETDRFPYVRCFGTVALIGVCSAVPTPPAIASGRMGAGQRDRLEKALKTLGVEGYRRVVMIHHPPLPGQAKKYRDLEDANELAELIAASGAELMLHGHNHQEMMAWADAPGSAASIPVIGVPSASMGRMHKGEEPLARYNLFTIGDDPAQSIEMVSRGLIDEGGDVQELSRRLLDAPATSTVV